MPQIKANGLNFEYETFGDRKNPAIQLIMGFSAQMTMWPVELCQGLADRGYHVIRFDNRDIGLSQKITTAGEVNVMEAFMKAASGQPVSAPYQLNDMAAAATSGERSGRGFGNLNRRQSLICVSGLALPGKAVPSTSNKPDALPPIITKPPGKLVPLMLTGATPETFSTSAPVLVIEAVAREPLPAKDNPPCTTKLPPTL